MLDLGRWIIREHMGSMDLTGTCKHCGTSVTIPRRVIVERDGDAYCALRCACTDEQEWREHFGILAEIFG